MSSSSNARQKFYSIPNISSDQLINPAFSNDNETSTIVIHPSPAPHTIVHLRRHSLNSTLTSSSTSTTIFFRHSFSFYLWRVLIAGLTILFATLCCHTIYQFKIEHLHAYRKLHNVTREKTATICRLFQSKLNLYYHIPANYVSLGILLLLICSQLIFQNLPARKKSTWKNFWKHLSIPMIFNAHSHIYRFQSAAVFGIIALEILHIFDEYIVNGAKHFNHGPLIDLSIQFGIGLLLGLRYCPILAIFEKENTYENRLENLLSYGLGSIYLYCEIIFKIQSDINCAFDQRKMSMIKETLEKLQHMGINVQEYLVEQFNLTNRTLPSVKHNFTHDESYEMENELTRLNYSLELNKQSILYNILRNAPYYYFIVYLAMCLTRLFFQTFRQKSLPSSCLSFPRWKYVKYNLLKTQPHDTVSEQTYSRLFRCLNSLILFCKDHIYCIRPYFRYSKLIICLYTSALTLVYYFTYWIQDHTYILTKKLLLFLNLILCGLADLSKDLCYNLNLNHLNRDIQYICLFTALITCAQLFFGLKHYQMQMCNAYRGVFTDIPKSKHISSVSIISKSIHYPGRFMGKFVLVSLDLLPSSFVFSGSLIYSYGFLFLFISIFYILSRYIFYSLIILEFLSKFFLPMLIFFLFQLLFIRLLCKLLFLQNAQFLALRNLRLYYTFSYFSFFFDCFLGFLMCLSRISKGFLCTLIFFARLDYSAYGRGLELYDSSYATYVSFFHVERNQRHPVLNVFIDIIRQRLIDKRRLKLKQIESSTSTELARFRWALAYTLIHNEQLKRFRKHRLRTNRTIQSRTLERLFDKIGLSQTLPRKY